MANKDVINIDDHKNRLHVPHRRNIECPRCYLTFDIREDDDFKKDRIDRQFTRIQELKSALTDIYTNFGEEPGITEIIDKVDPWDEVLH